MNWQASLPVWPLGEGEQGSQQTLEQQRLFKHEAYAWIGH